MNTVLTQVLKEFVSESWYFPQIRVVDAVEILIITFLFYQIILWIKNTKAWMLLRGILVVALFILVAAFFKMYTILWIAQNSLPVMATAVVIIFQPELRRALEKLGEKQFVPNMVALDKRGKDNVRFSQKTNRRSILCDGGSEDRSTYRRRAGNHADRIREYRNRAGLYCITAGIDQYF